MLRKKKEEKKKKIVRLSFTYRSDGIFWMIFASSGDNSSSSSWKTRTMCYLPMCSIERSKEDFINHKARKYSRDNRTIGQDDFDRRNDQIYGTFQSRM